VDPLPELTEEPIETLIDDSSLGTATARHRRTLAGDGSVDAVRLRIRCGPADSADEVRLRARRLAAAYPQQPVGSLIEELLGLQDDVLQLVQRDRRPRDTLVYAAIVSGMLAKASHDLGDPRCANAHARTAYLCADSAGHDGLRTWVCGLQSLVSYWAGWQHEALRYARMGAVMSERTYGSSAVWVASLEARAWALLGNHKDAVAALARAEVCRDGSVIDDLDEIGGILTFSQPQQLYYAADTLALLPRLAEDTQRAASRALAAYAGADRVDRSFSDEAGARTDLAVALVRLGDPSGARRALEPVLDLLVSQRINGIVSSVNRVRAVLDQQATAGPAARELRAEIGSFTNSAALG
jgi:hypothetical protein